MIGRTRRVAVALALAVALEASSAAGAGGVKLDAEQAATAELIRSVWPDAHEGDAVRVAWCESELRPWIVSPRNRNGTRDHGVFQLNDGGTMQGLGLTAAEALEPEANVRAALRLWRARRWRPWSCRRVLGRR